MTFNIFPNGLNITICQRALGAKPVISIIYNDFLGGQVAYSRHYTEIF